MLCSGAHSDGAGHLVSTMAVAVIVLLAKAHQSATYVDNSLHDNRHDSTYGWVNVVMKKCDLANEHWSGSVPTYTVCGHIYKYCG